MKLIKQSFQIEDLGADDGFEILKKIELAGRTCYKSENKITNTSAGEFVQKIIKSGHHSVLEHHNITVRIITDRGVTHEIVRHRLASYSQESTRYCDYQSDDIQFIHPVWLSEQDDTAILPIRVLFLSSLNYAEFYYKKLRESGWSPQQARAVLPNALKTEIVMTANLREWRHFFTLRCSKAAHPQMRHLAIEGLGKFVDLIPVVFDDIYDNV